MLFDDFSIVMTERFWQQCQSLLNRHVGLIDQQDLYWSGYNDPKRKDNIINLHNRIILTPLGTRNYRWKADTLKSFSSLHGWFPLKKNPCLYPSSNRLICQHDPGAKLQKCQICHQLLSTRNSLTSNMFVFFWAHFLR